ncbi:MAG: endonuclease domain-containing protein [Burkholderiales bacterium]
MLFHRYRPSLTAAARSLRNALTAPDRRLWFEFLRGHPVRFLRQKPLGPFIVDFFSAQIQLAIEIDGDGHYSAEAVDRDAMRSAWLKNQGIAVLRFSNEDVMRNFDGVCSEIERVLQGGVRGG